MVTVTIKPARGGSNLGKLTTASRVVSAQNLAGVVLPQVNVSQSYDHDVAGRLVKTLHGNVNGNSYALETQYWLDGTVKRKRLANGTWTGQFAHDLVGRLASFDNANLTSATEPDLFIQQQLYDARGQTTSISYGDGTTTEFSYNPARGFLTRVLSQRAATVHLDQRYVQKPKGLIMAITSSHTLPPKMPNYAISHLQDATNILNFKNKMVGGTGIEPVTPTMSR